MVLAIALSIFFIVGIESALSSPTCAAAWHDHRRLQEYETFYGWPYPDGFPPECVAALEESCSAPSVCAQTYCDGITLFDYADFEAFIEAVTAVCPLQTGCLGDESGSCCFCPCDCASCTLNAVGVSEA